MLTPQAHSHDVWRRTGALLLAILATLLPSGDTAHGQTSSSDEELLVTVKVEAKPEPKKAVGLVLSAGQTTEIADTTIKKVGEKLYAISFLVDRKVIKRDTVATAMAFDESGAVTFANVSPELIAEDTTLISRIPECPSEDHSAVIRKDQQGPLQQLVDVRTERAELARLKISRLLDDSLMTKLQQFESAFGLHKNEQLSANLPPEVLVDRLSRISQALRKYRMFKKPPTNATAKETEKR